MKKYTIIDPDWSLRTNLMAFGFDCDEGWHPMIYELLDKIQAIVDENPEYEDLRVTQIKEKYGGLRVYLNFDPPEISDMIDEYEEKSYETCEICGAKGKTREDRRWYKTLCDDCFQMWMKR